MSGPDLTFSNAAVIVHHKREDDSAYRQFRIRVSDANDDEYMTCSPVIEVASRQEVEEEGDVSCVAEDVTTSDDEIGRNDDSSPDCEWAVSSSSNEG